MMLCKGGRQALVLSKKPAGITRRVLAGVLCALVMGLFLPAVARAAVHASILVDAQTGHVLQQRNADKRAHPASLTKLMTLYITFGQLESGKLRLNQELKVSRHAASRQSAKLWLHPGSAITVRSAILAIVTKSANDAAVVLAEGISGSESRFARRMNRTARDIGMQHTTFYNASGLPDRRQWTTARDMSTLALAIIDDYPEYYHFFQVRSFVFRGHRVYGHDNLLGNYRGADGLKTGFIRSSGYNLVSSAVRQDRRLVGVVLGGSSAGARDRHMMKLLDLGFSKEPPALLRASTTQDAATRTQRKASLRLAHQAMDEDDSADVDPPDDSHWIVEVGGNYRSQSGVRRVLRSARLSAPSTLSAGDELVVKLRGRRYRARFAHLSRNQAMQACRALERKRYTCRVLNFEPSRDDYARGPAASSSQSD